MDESVAGANRTVANQGAIDQTMDESAAGANQTTVDQTMDPSIAEQTMDQTAQGSVSVSHGAGASKSGAGASISHGTGNASVSGSGSKSGGRSRVSVGKGSGSGAIASGSGDSSGGDLAEIPTRLGGYRILRMIGRGAMGAVYQAKQVSLDRDVALKTIRGRMADNPASLVRFTREAYAAAQLVHHNVVQIYDFGEDDGQHYFSMEWVKGGTLSDLVREKGSLDPKLAASYILQAARGLQFAHRSGMVHRDIKPANLLLSDEGVVKVADLGLVKVPDQVDPEESPDEPSGISGMQSGTQMTMQGTAVGTPAYMAPEQSADASTVDHRADIYSLGCSLFYLLAGQSPYDGTMASEVIQQHIRAPLPDLNEINSRVPSRLCSIVQRSMAKRPSDRFGSLAEMIDELQDFLGVESSTGFSPASDQADRWEEISAAYGKSQLARKTSGTLFIALLGVSALLLLIMPFTWLRGVLTGPTMFFAACATAIGLGMTLGNQPIADRIRGWFGTLSWFELGVGGFASIVVVLVTLVSGLWAGVLLGLFLGAAAGAGYHFAIAQPCKKSGQASLDEAKRFIRDLRLEGADENGLRDFLARYAGKSWQSIYEALFGYDALVTMREKLHGDNAFEGPTGQGSLRDRICSALSAKIEAKREAKSQAELAKVEQRSLISQGVDAATAKEQGWQMASALMESANTSVAQSDDDVKAIADAKRQRQKQMLADARSGKFKRERDKLAPLKFAFSGYTRMLVGCLLLAAFAVAAQKMGLLDPAVIDSIKSGGLDPNALPSDAKTDALGESTSLWSVGIAGLLLCLSAFVSGWRMTPFAAVATIVILYGPAMGIFGVGPVTAWMASAAVGVIIYVPGILFGESKTTE